MAIPDDHLLLWTLRSILPYTTNSACYRSLLGQHANSLFPRAITAYPNLLISLSESTHSFSIPTVCRTARQLFLLTSIHRDHSAGISCCKPNSLTCFQSQYRYLLCRLRKSQRGGKSNTRAFNAIIESLSHLVRQTHTPLSKNKI
jgi:hypothetical protein